MAYEKSKFNFHFKVLAIRLYAYLGALAPGFELYQSLECKHIQMDTFTHVLFDESLSQMIPACTEGLLFSMEHFYYESLRELPEMVTYPYVRQSYSRVRRDFT